jgi:DNA-binding MarR family transcriptional regulator
MDPEAHEVGAELRRAVTRLYSRFRSERLDGEVPDAALLVLLALDKRDDGMSLTGLADAAKVTLGSMSQTVRWLETSGLLSKTRDAVDRRRVVFTLTDAGRAASAASRQHRRDWLNGRIAELDDAERADLLRAAALLLRLADS